MAIRACPVTDQFNNQEVRYQTFIYRLVSNYTDYLDPTEVYETIEGIFEKDHSFTRTMREANPNIPSLTQRAVEMRLQEIQSSRSNETDEDSFIDVAACVALYALSYGWIEL